MSHRPLGIACLIVAIGLTATPALAGRPPAITLQDAKLHALISRFRTSEPDLGGVLAPDSRAIGILDRLLKSGRWQWTFATRFATFAPDVTIRSDKFTINIQKDLVIVNYEDKRGHFRHITRDITPAEYDEVYRAISEGIRPR